MNSSCSHNFVRINLSEPWDLGEQLNWDPLEGEIIAISDLYIGGAALIKLNEPFNYRKMNCEYFVATPRYQGSSIRSIAEGKPLLCGITRISKEKAESSNPFDLSSWRGGLAIIGELEPI
jgi:hypothetical protein